MIRTEGTFFTEFRKTMRGGLGTVKVETLWVPGVELKSKTRQYARMTLEPNTSIGYHDHVGEEEVYYILHGCGIVTENGKKYPISEGDSILTGNGAGHAIENSGPEPLVILAAIMMY